MVKLKSYLLLVVLLGLLISLSTYAQEGSVDSLSTDVKPNPTDSLRQDSTANVIVTDTIDLNLGSSSIDAPVNYSAKDSIIFDVRNKKVYLYNDAEVKQSDIGLKAGTITLDYDKKIMSAGTLKDSTGKKISKPEFLENGQKFEADALSYNFETRKGRLSELVTKEGEGFLRGAIVKKNERDEMFVKNGYYTTCNHEHPHFRIQIGKVKVVPDEVIVSGPAQLYLDDVPTPLFLPFGIFPLRQKQTSGLVMPSYGYSPRQGYYLTNAGIYLALGDHYDLSILGDIYTNLSWRLGVASQYRVRYKYNGSLTVQYGVNHTGDIITTDYETNRNYSINWRHTQDPKARPNSTFGANVNFASSQFNTEYQFRNNDVLSNQINSGINYAHSLPGTPFSIALSASHDLNLNTGLTNITLPQVTLNMARQFPFQRKQQVGSKKWYEKIGINYSAAALARLTTVDSLLFTEGVLDEVKYGMQQTMNMNVSYNLFKYISFSPRFNFTERWYLKSIRKEWVEETVEYVEENGEIVADTIPAHYENVGVNGFKAAHDFDGGGSFTTNLYGTFNFSKIGKGRVQAIRHRMSPNIGFNWRPDFADPIWGYYEYYKEPPEFYPTEDGTDPLRYSIFEEGVYGSPRTGKQASITFGASNNVQMKVLSKKDTTGTGTKKINLLDQFSINSAYNFAKDSLRLNDFSFTGATTLFNKKLRINFGGAFKPYDVNDNGRTIDQLLWTSQRKLARFDNFYVNMSSTFKPKSQKSTTRSFSNSSNITAAQQEIIDNPEEFVDFNIPWSLNVRYNLRFSSTFEDGDFTKSISTNSIQFRGDVSLTPNWKIAYDMGYDFRQKDFTRMTIDIYRDLHCWEMSMSLAPFGAWRRYEFSLNVKSAVLQDLKLTRQRRWQDYR